MKQLSGLDAAFLHLETGAQFGHVSGLAVFTPPGVPGYVLLDAILAEIDALAALAHDRSTAATTEPAAQR